MSVIRTILIAEDEEYNFILLEEFLAGVEVNLIHAYNGLEAIELYKANPQISLVLMDIKMPLMDGITAFNELKSINPELKIIALTAYALEQDRLQFREIGFDDYLSKPVRKPDLISKVKSFLKLDK
jgi:CheY-like chemotaxis protein